MYSWCELHTILSSCTRALTLIDALPIVGRPLTAPLYYTMSWKFSTCVAELADMFSVESLATSRSPSCPADLVAALFTVIHPQSKNRGTRKCQACDFFYSRQDMSRKLHRTVGDVPEVMLPRYVWRRMMHRFSQLEFIIEAGKIRFRRVHATPSSLLLSHSFRSSQRGPSAPQIPKTQR